MDNSAVFMRRAGFYTVLSVSGLLFGLSAVDGAAAATFSGVYAFKGGKDGSKPLAGVIVDGAGSVFGTTSAGGSGSKGVVFALSPPNSSEANWTEAPILSFNGGADGGLPKAGLVMDAAGNLYGTTASGGTSNNGVVFELTSTGTGTWTETVLYRFKGGADGSTPTASLALDSSGNLYGTTTKGGNGGNGVVFELSPGAAGSAWTESVLYTFKGGKDGSAPLAGVAFDSNGNLYGTASKAGGASKSGIVYRLLPASTTPWTEQVLYSFAGGKDGATPEAPVTVAKNVVYGTTYSGGGTTASGVVFQLTPGTTEPWTETVLYRFKGGADGAHPTVGVIADTKGNLFGATSRGGNAGGSGVVFELSQTAGVFAETVLHQFSGGADGGIPQGELVRNGTGTIFGTTVKGGLGNGVVFSVVP